MAELPQFEAPPVREIVVAVQFVPLAQFGAREALSAARAFEGWELVDVLPALAPIVETPSGVAAGQSLRLGLGTPPQRVVLRSPSGHQLAQVQQDRVAAHQRRDDQPPSFATARALLQAVVQRASAGLQRTLLEFPHESELIEVIYDNTVCIGHDPADLHRLLRIVDANPGDQPYDRVEQIRVGFTYVLREKQEFRGRLHVIAEPLLVPGEHPAVRLQLICRRIVGDQALDSVLAQSHVDIVRAFTAVTTEEMHHQWHRTR